MIKDLEISKVRNAANDWTIRVSLETENGIYSACSPSGKSAGLFEAKKLDASRIVKAFPKTKKMLIGRQEREVDRIIERFGINRIGANLSIALSIAAVRSLSDNDAYRFFDKRARTFPYPLGNVIGGGAHKGYTSEQEFLVIPLRARSMHEAVETNRDIWEIVGEVLKRRKLTDGNNYEGAWKCKLDDIETLEMLSNVAKDFGARIGIDFAASEFFSRGKYKYKNPKRTLDRKDQLDFVLYLIDSYKLAYVEDPFHEKDFESFAELSKKAKCMVTGDDLFVTNPQRLMQGIKLHAGNSIIVKPDQVGLVSKTMKTVKLAKRHRYKTIVSHRSGDTTDDFISDLALGTKSPVIKCGIHGKERQAKLQRLVELWHKTKSPKMHKLRF